MTRIEAGVVVDLEPAVAFAVSQTTGETRLRWDPFIHEQHFLDGALLPAKGVRTQTRHWSRLGMISEYVSFNPPSNVGMKMVGRARSSLALTSGTRWRSPRPACRASPGYACVT